MSGDVLLVLAGGLSRRLGRDKALVDLGDGEPLALRALRRLASLAPRRALVRAAPIAGLPDDVVKIADGRPGDGPLQALLAAFAAMPARRWFVAPCDLPALDASPYAAIARAAGSDGVACARRDGRLEPLVAVFTAPAAARLAREFAGEAAAPFTPLHVALERLGVATAVFAADDPRFANVNAPSDLAAARAGARPRTEGSLA